jgi:inorganic pyrophosphatase
VADLFVDAVCQIKALGCLAMIDDGELDWKVVCIDASDPKAALCNDVEDVEKHFPVSGPSPHTFYIVLVSTRRGGPVSPGRCPAR